MNPEMMEALQALAVDKGISVDTLFAALADALESAYKRMDGAYEYAATVTGRTIDSHIRRIRKKLSAAGADPIETAHGLGYKLGPGDA